MTKKVERRAEDKTSQVEDRTDWETLRNLSDAEIRERALKDPDSALPTEEELNEFRSARRTPHERKK